MTQKHKMDKAHSKILVRDLNSVITCRLCEGYFVDATTLVDCGHVFCRACILRHFENSKTSCPTCNNVCKKKSPQDYFRADPQIQSLVYKLVPSLYAKEMQRREDFHRSTGVRASSSCSDDSVIDREREMMNEQEEIISAYVGDKTEFFSPDDLISLSLEYYQLHLDTTNPEENPKTSVLTSVNNNAESESKRTVISEKSTKTSGSEQTDITKSEIISDAKTEKSVSESSVENNESSHKNNENDKPAVGDKHTSEKGDTQANRDCDKRFLQCPAAVSMKHLQKFIRMKYGLTADHRVDIIYKGEVLRANFSLMDVAYTFKWTRCKPMRFFYRIFTPMKIRPIKIVNTTLSSGGKQLQIVPVKPNPESVKLNECEEKEEDRSEEKVKEKEETKIEETEDQKNYKERLFAHLQLQSKTQAEKETKKVPENPPVKDCVFDYEEPDQEELKRFAEKRDREWALQKKLDESRKEENYASHHISKKRKKSKHSKNEFNVHKKRKLHAEIASNEEELKLKVKITNNGHKHKHHKSSGQGTDRTQNSEMTSKEKLLQMRQVRHKHMPSEDKNIQTVPSIKLSKDSGTSTEKIRIITNEKLVKEVKHHKIKENGEAIRKCSPKLNENIGKLKIRVAEASSNVSESAILPKQQKEDTSTSPKIGTLLESSSSKSNFLPSDSSENEWGKKVPTVHLERNEQTEKAQKSFHAYAEKYHKIEKIRQNKIENAKLKQVNSVNSIKPLDKLQQSKIENNKINTNNKNLDRKLANLQQHCTIEAKLPEQIEKKVCFSNEKHKILTPHYPPGFTVSKVEQGVKRKAEDGDLLQDKRPSLEITLINPSSSSPVLQTPKPMEKPTAKRPPPATIPLDRIKKSVNLKSGISIIPKMPERCDNIGALDLSKPNKSPEQSTKTSVKLDGTNGLSISPRPTNPCAPKPTTNGPEKSNMGLSNLQMLSKVATEHSSLNNKSPQQNNMVLNKPRPQMPNLQTLKIPSLQNPGQMKSPSLQKMPKLNEIQKFRPTNPQIRNLRPNQNQNIRNIPNPSLLIRQQNQNRLNSQSLMQQSGTESLKTTQNVLNNTSSSSVAKEPATSLPITHLLESKLQEKQEISV